MAKVYDIASLVVFISIWQTICGQNSCLNNPCLCCKNNTCETNNNNRCTDGCIDGFWGPRCYNDCPTKCIACTSLNNCDKCVDGRYGNSCESSCRNRCVSCISNNNCDECVNGRYGTSCVGQCYSECEYGMCDKEDGKCTCKAGYTSSFCKQCAPNEFGQYPDCNACPDKCLTCLSNTLCSKCKAGRYGSTCRNNCSTQCKDSLCNIDGSCIACPDGYYGSLCKSECPGHCIKCFSSNNCSACTSGLFGTLCNEACPANCIDCTSPASCQTCKPGFKGAACDDKCANCKLGTKCDQSNGRCETCIDGKYWDDCGHDCGPSCLACKRKVADQCTECKAGKYGKYINSYIHCQNDCLVNNCLNKKCDTITGECPACKDGFKGTYCRCPVNCDTCNMNGQCQSCIAGYVNIDNRCKCTIDKCLTLACDQCNDLTWYPDVNGQSCCQCSSNCKGGQCVSDTKCASGCEDGYYGKACDKLCSNIVDGCLQCTADDNDNYHKCSKCSPGYYPEPNNCKVCNSNCKNANCDQSSGKCLDGCKNGFWGDTCESSCHITCLTCNQATGVCDVCKHGQYTKECSVSCSANCTVLEGEGLKCRINDGACLNGCISTKLYGLQCSDNCSSNCKDRECEWQTGNCLNCVANTYGLKCSNECSNNCVTNEQNSKLTRCNGENGTCTVGCISGFRGLKCEDSCSQFCRNTTCDRQNGECLYGCMDGYIGGTCTQALVSSEPVTKSEQGPAIGGAFGGIVVVVLIVIAVVFLVRRRRASNSKYASTHSNDEIQNKHKDMSDPVHSYYNTNESASAPEVETTNEYEELDEVPQNMQRSGLSADNDGEDVVIETGDVNTYEPLGRPEMHTDVYSQLEQRAYENTTI